MPLARFTARYVESIASIDARAWDACANPPGLTEAEAVGERHNPFISHAFLLALEQSKSVGGRTGWMPAHVLVEDEAGRLVAAAPTYLKSHSMGEYVFDHSWAQAYEHAGGRYYPKIQVAAPFTPVTGRRLLVAADAPEGARDALIAALRGLRKATGASSIHVTFATEPDTLALTRAGFALRAGEQFHFLNDGYADFDAFLAALASRKRKAIRKEREQVLREGLTVRALSGGDIRPEHWDAFFAFYMDTGGRKWGTPYLTRSFFDILGATMADKVVLVLAEADGRPVGGALNLKGDDTLYGRYWGCLESHAFLHFEACYYQAIDYAIAHGLQRVEAGAQGDHKIQRGYLPVPTYSAHWIVDKSFRRAVDDYLSRERPAVEQEIQSLMQYSPFKKENEG